MNLQPVILSGGSGTRLWPLSREKYPKQLLNLFGAYTMLQSTARRLDDFVCESYDVNSELLVVSNQEYRFIVAEQLKQIHIETKLILEPVGKNTAPALTVAALQLLSDKKDVIMLVMPADHIIQDNLEFQTAIKLGLTKAQEGSVICFGIEPTRPDTGYGYIKVSKSNSNVRLLDSFVEKPTAEVAVDYVKSGEYTWNSGIFMMKASVWIELIKALEPEMYQACKVSISKAVNDKDFVWLDEESFKKSPDNSIDYAVMEHLGKENGFNIDTYVVAMNAGWSDVGAWDAVWENHQKDESGNVSIGNKNNIFYRTENTLLYASERKKVVTLGIKDCVVIDTPDALLVANKNNLSSFKDLIQKIKENDADILKQSRKVFRPWGCYDSLEIDTNFQVKRITVNPGQVLSLQLHHHRAEHWIVVKGTGKVTKGQEEFLLHENQSIYIPLGEVHRLENPGKIPLEMIEVQSGSYLGEDDIVRLEDIYGRLNK